ncbi:ABC transporter permease [Nocardioides albus]|uniref:Transport permease protein n=1 Tax=Nocardioides albus TaxID=1841 RepID=A0A7W5A6T1_9ACTN|nr:ABC transporter permease [Nocardioides albus]MBB3090748.1 ABC-2 type transport system permease protein [Nocardioides albus]GGU26168.1 transport permease protein [Nocardioides albus]
MTTLTVPTAQARRTSRTLSRPTGFLTDTWTVLSRELTPKLRQPASMLFAMVQPLVFLGLFAPLLPDVENGSALQWFVPGIVVMTALMGASMTGADLTAEIRSGSHERLLVSPLSRPSLLVGRALKEVVPVLFQTAVILAVVTPFSFDLHLGGALVGSVIVSLFAIGLGAFSFALATAAKEQDWVFWTVQQMLIFPLLLLSGVLLPLDGAPGWLRFLSDINPMTYVVEAARALFAGEFPADVVLSGFVAATAVAAVGVLVGVRTMERSN